MEKIIAAILLGVCMFSFLYFIEHPYIFKEKIFSKSGTFADFLKIEPLEWQ